MITLWFMATSDSYRSVCVKFGVGRATALCAVRRVTYTLHWLAPRFIKWPKREDVIHVIEKFQRIKNFPGVIGAIDGFLIQIRTPEKDKAFYICRKNYPAIHLQAVCDARNLFTYCYAGHAGLCMTHAFLEILLFLSLSRDQINIFLSILIFLEHIQFIHMSSYHLEIMDILL